MVGAGPDNGGGRPGVPRGRRRARVLLGILLVLPALPYLLTLPHFGACQYNDYYGVLLLLQEGSGITRDPVRWLTLRSNEHTITLPALAWAANIALTHGDNRGLSTFALGLLFVILLLLAARIRRDLEPAGPGRPVAYFLLSAALFCPSPAHSVVMGFSGSIWFLSNAFTVAALVLVTERRRGRPLPVWLAVAAGLLGALSYSTNLSLWPALLAAAALAGRPRRDLVPLLAGLLAVGLFFALRYHPLPYHPRPEVAHPGLVLRHAVVYLGGFAWGEVGPAALAGSAALVVSLALWVFLARRGSPSRRAMAPWVGLQVSALGNALGTGVGRAGYGPEQALTSRYASLAALFWIGLGVLAVLAVHRPGELPARRTRRGVLATAALSLLLAVAWIHGLRVLGTYLRHAAGQPLAAEALRLDIPDLEAFRALSPVPDQVWASAPLLRNLGHVPFDRPPASWTDLPASISTEAGSPPVRGWADSFRPLPGGVVRVTGWAWCGPDPVEEVLVVDAAGQPLARMVYGLPRPDVARRVDPGAGRSGWAGYLPPHAGPGRVRAVARLRSGSWSPVPGEIDLPPSPSTED